eukprot:8751080-Alexandrium_andersonii.AAC.1
MLRGFWRGAEQSQVSWAGTCTHRAIWPKSANWHQSKPEEAPAPAHPKDRPARSAVRNWQKSLSAPLRGIGENALSRIRLVHCTETCLISSRWADEAPSQSLEL